MSIKEELLKLFAPVFAEVEPRVLTETSVALFLLLSIAYVVLRIRRKEREHTAAYEQRLEQLKLEIDALAAKKRRDEIAAEQPTAPAPTKTVEPAPLLEEPSLEPVSPAAGQPPITAAEIKPVASSEPLPIAPIPPAPPVEPEAQKRGSLLSGLQRSRSQILGKLRGLFGAGTQVSEEFFTELEEHFISSEQVWVSSKETRRLKPASPSCS